MPKIPRAVKWLTLLALVLAPILAVGAAGYYINSQTCMTTHAPPVTGPDGWEITASTIDCDTLAKQADTSIYIHRKDEPEGASNMVLQFDREGEEIRWLGPHEVWIKVYGLAKNEITIQKNRLGDIKIDYDFTASGTPLDIGR